MILDAFFIFSSTQLCVLRPFNMMTKKKIENCLKLLQNKIPNAPIRVGLRPLLTANRIFGLEKCFSGPLISFYARTESWVECGALE